MMSSKTANRLWMQMLLRDRFKTILLKRLQQGQWISPADFKKYTTPHTHHCFHLYMNRPCDFRRYLSKRHFHKTAKAAVFRLASSGVPQSRLNSQLDPFPREKKFFSPNEPNFLNQPSRQNHFLQNKPNFQTPPNERNSFPDSWLLKASDLLSLQKTNPNKANLKDCLVIPFTTFMARLTAYEQSDPFG